MAPFLGSLKSWSAYLKAPRWPQARFQRAPLPPFPFWWAKSHPGAEDNDVEGGVDVEKEEPGLPLEEKVKVGHGVVPMLGTFKKLSEFWEQILLESSLFLVRNLKRKFSGILAFWKFLSFKVLDIWAMSCSAYVCEKRLENAEFVIFYWSELEINSSTERVPNLSCRLIPHLVLKIAI